VRPCFALELAYDRASRIRFPRLRTACALAVVFAVLASSMASTPATLSARVLCSARHQVPMARLAFVPIPGGGPTVPLVWVSYILAELLFAECTIVRGSNK
jgi:hypothetical protein